MLTQTVKDLQNGYVYVIAKNIIKLKQQGVTLKAGVQSHVDVLREKKQ